MTFHEIEKSHVGGIVRVAALVAVAAVAALIVGAVPAGASHGSNACISDCAKVPILFDKQFARPGTGNPPGGQPSEEWDGSAVTPDPLLTTGTADTREFTVLAGSDVLTVEITWDAGQALLYDLDLYIDRKTAVGTWQQVGDGTNGQLAGDGEPNEIAIVQRPEPGTYRTRVVNFASTQFEYHGLLWFTPAQKSKKATSGRSTVDRPDTISGSKVHVIYFVPSDGQDNQLDINGVLESSVASMNTFLQADIGRTLRLDTYRDGKTDRLDVSFVRGELTAAEYSGSGDAITAVTEELEHRGWNESGAVKRYFVYYEGPAEDSNICGTAFLSIVGGFAQWSVVWLGSAPGCGARDFGTPETGGGMSEAIALHENFHNEGMVPLTAPHQCWAFQFHLCSAAAGAALDTLDPESVDLLFPFVTFPLRDKFVDPGHDDYYDHPFPYRDMADSPFWNL